MLVTEATAKYDITCIKSRHKLWITIPRRGFSFPTRQPIGDNVIILPNAIKLLVMWSDKWSHICWSMANKDYINPTRYLPGSQFKQTDWRWMKLYAIRRHTAKHQLEIDKGDNIGSLILSLTCSVIFYVHFTDLMILLWVAVLICLQFLSWYIYVAHVDAFNRNILFTTSHRQNVYQVVFICSIKSILFQYKNTEIISAFLPYMQTLVQHNCRSF